MDDILLATSTGYNATFTADSAGSDKIVFWDQSANKLTYLTVGSGLTLSGTTLSVPAVNTDLVTDTTPQLGGDLDVNGNDIVTTNNGDIDLDPNGSGSVVPKATPVEALVRIIFNCEFNSHGVTLKGPAHSAVGRPIPSRFRAAQAPMDTCCHQWIWVNVMGRTASCSHHQQQLRRRHQRQQRCHLI